MHLNLHERRFPYAQVDVLLWAQKQLEHLQPEGLSCRRGRGEVCDGGSFTSV